MEATLKRIAETIPDAESRIGEWTKTVEQYLESPDEETYKSVASQGDELIRQVDNSPRYSYSYISDGKVLRGGLHPLETVI